MSGGARGGSLRAALRHADFRRLLVASTVSQTGDWLYNVALAVYVFDRTGSAGWVAVVTFARLVPYVLLAPLGGVIADHVERRRVLVASDALRAGLMALLALVAAVDAPVGLTALLAFATTAAGTAYFPAVVAMTPSLVGEDDLAAANGVNAVIESASIIVGPAIGAGVLALGSPASAFTVNALTFVGSGLVSAAIRTRDVPAPAEPHAEGAGVMARVSAGGRVLLRDPASRSLAAFMLGTSFVYGVQTVVLVLVADEQLHAGSDAVGYLFAAAGVGGLLAAPLASRLSGSARLGSTIFGALVLAAAPMALFTVVDVPVVIGALVAAGALGEVVVDVLVVTLLQRTLASEVTGRVFGALDSLAMLAILAGSVVVPPLVDAFGLTSTLVVVAVAVPVLVGLGGRGLLTADRAGAEMARALAPLVEVLDRLSVFDGAPRPVLEQLARAAVPEDVAAGHPVVVEGDPADDFFVVEAGACDVVRRGPDGGPVLLARLGAGDYFGEIGLLHRAPRNATVRTTEPTRLLRVAGSDFLDAVNTSPIAAARLLEGVASRLAVNVA